MSELLEFIKEKLNHGSIIIFDEYNGFKSDENLVEFRNSIMKKFLLDLRNLNWSA